MPLSAPVLGSLTNLSKSPNSAAMTFGSNFPEPLIFELCLVAELVKSLYQFLGLLDP